MPHVKNPYKRALRDARESIRQADLLGFEANRQNQSNIARGSFGGRKLRAGGSISRYILPRKPRL